jgi:hypothetical protein
MVVGDFEQVSSQAGASAPVFVRALDLPTASLRAAREAVAMQLDILSPMPAADTVASVRLLGPAENGLTRFAVGLAPLARFDTLAAQGAKGPAGLYLTGELDGEALTFRFDNPYRQLALAEGREQIVVLAMLGGLCAVLVLGPLSLRLGHEAERAQARLETTQQVVRLASQQKRLQGDARRLWDDVAAPRNARMVSCTFNALASAGGGQMLLSELAVGDGTASVGLSQPLSPGQAQGLGALGGRTAPGDPQRVVLNAAACR